MACPLGLSFPGLPSSSPACRAKPVSWRTVSGHRGWGEQGERGPEATLRDVSGQCPPVLRLKSEGHQDCTFWNNTLWGRHTFFNTSERDSSRTFLPSGQES